MTSWRDNESTDCVAEIPFSSDESPYPDWNGWKLRCISVYGLKLRFFEEIEVYRRGPCRGSSCYETQSSSITVRTLLAPIAHMVKHASIRKFGSSKTRGHKGSATPHRDGPVVISIAGRSRRFIREPPRVRP